jgi:ligand-binding sensor domain-containing protein/two-component sensor histidine kinase
MFVFQYQNTQQVPNVLDTGSGLSNNIVHNTFQDQDGFIWIATLSGLNRFDGYEIVSFFHHPGDSSSLSSNTIRAIVEDSTGTMWVGSYNGLNEYDSETKQFKRFLELPELPTSRLDLQELIYDEIAHRIWFNTIQTTGWFDIETRKFHFLPKEFETFSITKHDDGILVLTKNHELYLVNRIDAALTKLGEIPDDKLNPIHFGEITSKLWLPASNLIEDTNQLDWEGLPIELYSKQITSIKEVSQSKLWVGTDEGLFEFDHSKNTISSISLSDEPSFLTNSIQSIFMDATSGIWVGTLGGLFYFNSAESEFLHYDFTQGSGDVIMGLAYDEHKVLINIFSNEIAELNIKNYEVSQSELNSLLSGEELQVWDFEIVPNSKFKYWIATNNGLILYDPTTKQIERRYFDQLYSQAIFAIEPAFEGSIFVSTLSNIHELNVQDGEIIRTIPTIDFVKQSNIQDLLLIDDWMFFATEGEGLAKVNINTNELIEITLGSSQVENPLKNNAIWDIQVGRENKLWIGTSRGLFYFDIESEDLNQISYADFITNRIVYSILEYDDDIWIGTEQGLIQISIEEETYKIFGTNEGVLNFEFNRRSALETNEGLFLFGGVEGLTMFDPSKISDSSIIPPLHIIEMQVYEQDSSFTPINYANSESELAWNQNTIELSFAALNYSNPDGMYYRYQLVGLEANWVIDRSSRNPRYAQLPPGDYEFLVQSSLTPSFTEVESASLSFKINPPFWQTSLFRFTVISLVLLIVWAVYRYRVDSLLEVERVRLRIARDLHDEVGSGLSGIALAGDILTHKMEFNSNGEVEEIKKITSNARAMASSLDGIVWLIDSNKESVGDLIAKCRSVSKELLINHRVNFSSNLTEYQNELSLSSESKRHLFLLFKEAINNLLKHASADLADIKFSFNEGFLHLTISDDGKGYDSQKIERGNGIDSMNHRASELGAELQIESKISVGTTIELKLKLPESRYS